MLWDAQSSIRIPAQARDFSLLQNVNTSSGTLPASYSADTVVLPRGTTVKGATLIIQPPASAKLKNEYSYTSTPLYTLRTWTRKFFSFHMFICSLLTTLLVREYTASNDDV